MLLTDQLRDATRRIHLQAEQSGVIATLLSGSIDRASYVRYLRNLASVYYALEQPAAVLSLGSALQRFPSIASDLTAIVGTNWESTLPVLPATQLYCDRIDSLVRNNSKPLIAHYYVRYLGDLYGGQILRRRLQSSLGLQAQQLSWYQFDQGLSLQQHREALRAAINGCALSSEQVNEVIEEALAAFQHNIELSIEAAAAE
jgi:heme oxygenase